MSNYEPPRPHEIITVVLCPGCEELSFFNELQESEKDSIQANKKLVCGNCETVVSADNIWDYALMGGIHTDE